MPSTEHREASDEHVHRDASEPSAPHGRRRSRVPDALRRWALPAVAAAAVLVVVGRATDLVAAMQGNADFAAPLVMAELAHRYPGTPLLTGNYGWWSGLWAVQALRPIPGNSYLAAYLPLAIHGGLAAALAWRGRRLFGTGAAPAVLVVAILASPEALTHAAAWSARTPSWAGVVLIGLAVTAFRPGLRGRALAGWLLATAAAVAIGAAAFSGDSLGYVVALGALGVSALAALRRGRWGTASVAALVAAALVLVTRLLAGLATDAGYTKVDLPLPLRGPESVSGGIGASIGALTEVWRSGSGSLRPLQWLGVAAGVLAAVLVLAGLVLALRRLLERAPADEADPAPRDAWAAYWAGAALVALAAFAGTTAGQSARYLFLMPLVGGALVAPLAAARGARLVPIAVAAFGVVAVLGLATQPLRPDPVTRPDPLGRTELRSTVLERTSALGIRKGYAPYWSSYPLTLAAGFETVALPVGQCAGAAADRLCPMYLHIAAGAYRPEPGVRTFLLVDPASPTTDAGTAVRALPTGAQPSGSFAVGQGATLYTFDYDVARDLG